MRKFYTTVEEIIKSTIIVTDSKIFFSIIEQSHKTFIEDAEDMNNILTSFIQWS